MRNDQPTNTKPGAGPRPPNFDPPCEEEDSQFYRRDSRTGQNIRNIQSRDFLYDGYCEFIEGDDAGKIVESIMGNIGLPRLYASPDAQAFEMAIYHSGFSSDKVDIFASGNYRAMMWMTRELETSAPSCLDSHWNMPPRRSGFVDGTALPPLDGDTRLHNQVCYGPWAPRNTDLEHYELDYGGLAKELNRLCRDIGNNRISKPTPAAAISGTAGSETPAIKIFPVRTCLGRGEMETAGHIRTWSTRARNKLILVGIRRVRRDMRIIMGELRRISCSMMRISIMRMEIPGNTRAGI